MERHFWEVDSVLDKLIEMFSYPFMVRAILVGTMVSLCSAFWELVLC